MARKKLRLVVETTPPRSRSPEKEARWVKLGDSALHQEPERDRPRQAGNRAHQDHERLKEELRNAVNEYDPDTLKRAS